MIEEDLCRSAIFGRSMRFLLDIGLVVDGCSSDSDTDDELDALDRGGDLCTKYCDDVYSVGPAYAGVTVRGIAADIVLDCADRP